MILGRALAGAAALALVATPALARRPERAPGVGTANPSALVAAEIAFARLAREKGQWTAFRETAAEDAIMFVPQPVRAQTWLSGRKDPPASVQWQPRQVWMSCDGTLGVTKGAWQRPDGSVGYFTTIWQQRRKKTDYRWVLDQGDTLAQPLPDSDMLSASVADCPRGAGNYGGPRPDMQRPEPAKGPPGMTGEGRSDDGTLTWRYSVAADQSRSLVVSLMKNGTLAEVMRSDVAAPKAP